MKTRYVLPGAALALLSLMASGIESTHASNATLPELQTMSARFAPVDVSVDVSKLPDNERQALVRIIQAAQIVDAVFMRQRSPSNEARLLALLNDRTPLGQSRLQYFLLNRGPWSELDEDKPFVDGVETKPPQASFYPADATRAEVDQ
jgi:hypothetical protein